MCKLRPPKQIVRSMVRHEETFFFLKKRIKCVTPSDSVKFYF